MEIADNRTVGSLCIHLIVDPHPFSLAVGESLLQAGLRSHGFIKMAITDTITVTTKKLRSREAKLM